MPTLHDLQSDFRRFIAGEPPADLLAIVDADGLDPASRLSIYRNNTLITLAESLSETFPIVCRLVDPRFFAYAAQTFIEKCPPSHPCLSEYGAQFADFLETFLSAAGLGYLPDLARLEWAISRVLCNGGRASSIPVTSLANAHCDPAQLRLRLDPGSIYIASSYPVHRIWKANQTDTDSEEARLDKTGVHLEVRYVEGLSIREVPSEIWTFRSRLAESETLGAAAEAALEADGSFDLTRALVAVFHEELIVGISEPDLPVSRVYRA